MLFKFLKLHRMNIYYCWKNGRVIGDNFSMKTLCVPFEIFIVFTYTYDIYQQHHIYYLLLNKDIDNMLIGLYFFF